MELDHDFTVPVPVDQAWSVLLDVERVAACMPGATLDGVDGEEYSGRMKVKVGAMTITYRGTARIVSADEANHRMELKAAGSEDRGRGEAEMTITATMAPTGGGTRVRVAQDLSISGAAANYGRGLIADVTSVLLGSFAECVQANIAGGGGTATAVRAAPASGFAIGLRATVMALKRVFARFFLPYDRSR